MTPVSGPTSSKYVNLLLLIALGTIWGASYLFIKVIVAEVPAFTLVAGRLSVAALTMWGIVRVLGQTMPRSSRMWGAFALLGLVGLAVPYMLITWGEQYISSGLASLLQATTPLFTVLLAQLWARDERITVARATGVLVGFAGVALLMLPDLQSGVRASLPGQLAIVGSSLCYAWTAIYARRWLQGQPPLTSATGQLTMGAAFTLPASLLFDRPAGLSLSLPAWASWAALTLLGTVLAYVIYYTLIARTSATFTTMTTYIIPINGVVLGALVLHEPLSLTILASLVLILVAVLLVRGRKL
jgi:drug/metabolite transporter (DMT)-like permease